MNTGVRCYLKFCDECGAHITYPYRNQWLCEPCRIEHIRASGMPTPDDLRKDHRKGYWATAEAIVGRRLKRSEVVHHKDLNRKNNTPDNLEVMSGSLHRSLHQALRLERRDTADSIAMIRAFFEANP